MIGASSTGAGLAVLIIFLVSVGLYFIPAIIAYSRKVTNAGSVLVINIFLGWTFIGWIVALAMAVRTITTQVVVNVSAAPISQVPSDSPNATPTPASGAPLRAAPLMAKPQARAKTCLACNATLEPEHQFCPSCGAPASSD